MPIHQNLKICEEYFCNQAGHGISHFIDGCCQRGHGIGSIFSGLGHMALPWLKTWGKALLKEGMDNGLKKKKKKAQDFVSGKNFGESMRYIVKQAFSAWCYWHNQRAVLDDDENEHHHPVNPLEKKIKRSTKARWSSNSNNPMTRKPTKKLHSDICAWCLLFTTIHMNVFILV